MTIAHVNGINLFFQQFGRGPDLVFIHGLAANHAFWYLPIARRLHDRFRVTLLDLRGHGYSDMPRHGYTPDIMTQDLHQLLDAAGLAQVSLIGHSLGGAVALSYAQRHPERVHRVVLADVRINRLQPVQRLEDSPHLSKFEEAFIEGASSDWHRETDVGMRFLEEASKARQRRRLRETSRQTRSSFIPFGGPRGNQKAARKWQRLLSDTTAREELRRPFHLDASDISRIEAPTFLMYGERSRCLPTMTRLQELMPRASAFTVANAGHFHPVTRPRLFVRAVQAYLHSEERGVDELRRDAGRESLDEDVVDAFN